MGAGTPGGLSLDEEGRLQECASQLRRNLTELSAVVADEVEKAKVFLEIASRR